MFDAPVTPEIAAHVEAGRSVLVIGGMQPRGSYDGRALRYDQLRFLARAGNIVWVKNEGEIPPLAKRAFKVCIRQEPAIA